MDFRLLGPFEARHQGTRITLPARRQERCILGILLLDAGHVVSTARLVDLLWNGAAPPSARGTVHTYIGRLRAALRSHGAHIETRSDGYTVDPAGHTIDARTFLDLVAGAGTDGDPGARLTGYDRALALWRGPVLADTADDALRGRLGGRLAELRLTALEQRAEVHLELGRPDRVIADLGGPADDHPARERLVAALMTALYRDGRRGEALDLYRRTARHLATVLGLDPDPGLARLHARILDGDPRLASPARPARAITVGGEQLPWGVGGHPALDFCNTYAGWSHPGRPAADWLRHYPTLAVWAGHTDLAEDHTVAALLRQAAEDPGAAAAALAEARTFRTAVYRCLIDPADTRAFNTVAAAAQEAARNAVFTLGSHGLGAWRLPPSAGLRLPLHAVARSAAELLADPRRFTICRCPAEDCGWLFLDPSGRRRWCSQAACGKRYAAFAAPDPSPRYSDTITG
ncbi:BTAD domain-containing putative transcriptional regulator [Yinghuangia soli]|uniref:ABATE domain-containing protein n=1 Tax=Yinghuangia soli TaxID=2908204 RepID=A0AA41U119_9ACTN|nr:BTAD domain-containing putative transcriptional regulator [Yinghuangia soli]MCF2529186.1 ABATE domain-containing protein [Yinghuangia soli]